MRPCHFGAATPNESGPQGRVTARHRAGKRCIMETRPPVPRATLVGIQIPGFNDVAHAADIEELGRLVKTLGYEVVGTISQKRDETGGGTVLAKGGLRNPRGRTGGPGMSER